MDKAAFSAFSENVISQINEIQKFPHDKDYLRKPDTVNRRFGALNLSYRIQHDKQAKQYVLRKEEVDSYAGK